MKIVYTLTDEAPLLATYSFLPVVQAYASAAGVDSNGERVGAAIAWVTVAATPRSPSLGVLQVLPNAVMLEPAAAVQRSGTVVGLVSVLWAGALAFQLSMKWRAPMEKR